MHFKPAKSRSMVLRKRRVTDQFSFFLGGTRIPSMTEMPIKKPGKIFTCTQATSDDLNTWFAAMDKSGLPRKFKAWIYQHGILPQLLCPLLIYEVPMTIMEGF